MRTLTAVTAFATLILAGAAQAATFTSPRTLADWSPGGQMLAAAPGAAVWTHPEGMRFWRDGAGLARIPGGEGMVQEVLVGAASRPFAAWVDSQMRLHAYTERDELIEGTTDRVRNLAAAPSALAWVGVAKDDSRKVQLAVRRADGGFSAARTPEQLGRPVFGIAAAGDRERSLVAWSVEHGGVRRAELLTIDAGGRVSEPRWLTAADRDSGRPTVAVGPSGEGLAAWVDGISSGPVVAVPVDLDGEVGAPQTLDSEPGGPPGLDVGRGGAAVAVWPAGGNLRVALRTAGAAGFSAPVTLTAESLWDWSAAVTPDGETIVAWLDAGQATNPRAGGRLMAAVAPAGGALGAPVELADQVHAIDGAGDALTWVEQRSDTERRVRFARLRDSGAPSGGSTGGGEPGAADRRAPRVKLRVLGVRGRRIRVQLRSDERAALRATWRRGARTVGRARGTLRAGRPRVLRVKAPAGARRITLTARVTDAAGNRRTVRRVVRLRPRT